MRKLSEEDRDKMVEEYVAGAKTDYLGAKYNVSREYPGKAAHRRGVKRRRIVTRYEHLTDEMREQIIERYKDGEDLRTLCAEFKIDSRYPGRLAHDWHPDAERRRKQWLSAGGAAGPVRGASTVGETTLGRSP